MRGFWLPIGLRAAAIFIIGLALYTGFRHLTRHVHVDSEHDVRVAEQAAEAAHSAADAAAKGVEADMAALDAQMKAMRVDLDAAHASGQATKASLGAKAAGIGALATLAGMSRSKAVPPDFVFDGHRIGSLIRFKGARAGQDTPARFQLAVRLDAGRAAVACDVAPVTPDNFELDQGFRCVSEGESGLVPVGTVRFEPAGVTRAIKASPRMAGDLAKGDPFAIDADLSGPMSLVVNGKDGERVRLRSDSQNTAIVVHDDQGREVVKLQAGKKGFAIVVDTTAK
jgi:hypothetical protein